jgi:hypothetical protein
MQILGENRSIGLQNLVYLRAQIRPEFCIYIGLITLGFPVLFHSTCKKFFAHMRLTENRQDYNGPYIQGSAFALALSRNSKNLYIDGVLV